MFAAKQAGFHPNIDPPPRKILERRSFAHVSIPFSVEQTAQQSGSPILNKSFMKVYDHPSI